MNKELEKKFDEEFLVELTQNHVGKTNYFDLIKSFIDENFVEKEPWPKLDWEEEKKLLEKLYTKEQVLELIGEDVPQGGEEEFTYAPGYNQAKQEARERLENL